MIRWQPRFFAGIRNYPPAARTRMAMSVPLLATRGDRVARAVARALGSAALGRVTAEERSWIARIEARRRQLTSERALTEPSFDPNPDQPRPWWGAGQPVPVGAAAALMSLPPVWCLLLMRLVRTLRPRSCLELGTGLGISGAYQGAALELNGTGSLTTMEGAAEWAEIAQRGFAKLGLSRVETVVGPIAEKLAGDRSGPFDHVLVDAEHTEEAMLEAFEMLLPDLSAEAVVVFDDIDFYEGSRRAWSRIKSHPNVSAAVGARRFGIAIVSGSTT
jgi:predicted O-methyltransferase YrrM